MSTPERIVPFPVTQPDDERDSRDSRGSRELAGSIITLVKTQSKKDQMADMGADHNEVEDMVRNMVHSDRRKKDNHKVRFSQPTSL